MAKIIKQTFKCPHCGENKQFTGISGKKYFTSCPNCKNKGYVTFPKLQTKEIIKNPVLKNKHSLLSRKKKSILKYSIPGVFAFLFIVFVLIPALTGSLHFLIVLSGSMEPSIHPGDVVVTSATDIEDVEIGDIITFNQKHSDDPKQCVTHRVVNIFYDSGEMQLLTKGDSNEDPDATLVTSSLLIGKVVLTIPYLGHLPGLVQSPLGFVLLFIFPATLLIITELRNIFNTNKKEPSEKLRRNMENG